MKQELVLKEKLPGGWKWSTIQEVCKQKPQSGGTPLSSNSAYYGGNIPWVITEDLTSAGRYINSTLKKITQKGFDESNVRLFPKGTILFAMYGSIGRMSIAQIELTTNQAILGLIPDDKIIVSEYLYYYLEFTKNILIKKGRGGTQSNVNAKMVCEFSILLPPLQVQKKIVAKLDAQMVQIEIMKMEAEKEEGAGISLFESCLIKFFKNIEGKEYAISDIITKDVAGFACNIQSLVDEKKGYLHMRPFNLNSYSEIDFSEKYYVPIEMVDTTVYNLKAGDILFNNTNSAELVGKSVLIKKDIAAAFSNHINKIVVNKNKILPEYFAFYLSYLWVTNEFLNNCKRWIGQAGYALSKLKLEKIIVPDLEKQQKIVNELNLIKKGKKDLIDYSENAINAISQLQSSILNEIFGKYEIPQEVGNG